MMNHAELLSRLDGILVGKRGERTAPHRISPSIYSYVSLPCNTVSRGFSDLKMCGQS